MHIKKIKGISGSTLKRLPIYLTYLKSLQKERSSNISATAIANSLKMGEVQVRKDLASISDAGKPKVGYVIADLIKTLESFLGYENVNDAVIVGTGKLGRALLDYQGFSEYGLNIVAGFDIDPSLEGQTDSKKSIFLLEKFTDLCQRLKIRIGIITVPVKNAQSVCDIMVKSGILAIWNFAPIYLDVPKNILVQNENIAASLALLSSQLTEQLNKKSE